MKKFLALFAALLVVCTTLVSPLAAAPASKANANSSKASSESASKPSKKEDASKDTASKDANAKDTSSTGKTDKPAVTPGASPSPYIPPDEEKLKSQAIYLLNLDSGETLYERNSQERIEPASLIKILVCVMALESGKNLKSETTSLSTGVQNYLYTQGAGDGGIYQGMVFPVNDLLYAMMLPSSNTAAMMVANYLGGGDMEDFCVMLNKKAKEIGAVNTHFSNASGLHVEGEENYTTAYDMAMIAKYAMQNPEFVEIVSTRSFTSTPEGGPESGITWNSINRMMNPADLDDYGISYYYEGLKGVKTGTLPDQNLRNFVSTATRDGYSYLLVCLGAPYRNPEDGLIYKYNLAFQDTKMLYDWAFQNFKVKTLMSVGEEVAGVNVRLSWDKKYIKLLASDKFATLVHKDVTTDDIKPEVEIFKAKERPVKGQKGKTEKYLDAPISKGDVVGRVRLMLLGEEVGSVPLVAGESVEQSKSLYYLEKVKGFFSHFIFKFILVFLLVVILLYIALMLVRNHNKKRYQNHRKRPPQKRPPARPKK